MEVTYLDTDNSCRVCLTSCNENLVSLFDPDEDPQLYEVLKIIASVKIVLNDSLSQKICLECRTKALDAHSFRAMCLDSDESVRYHIALQQTQDDEDNVIFEEEEEEEQCMEFDARYVIKDFKIDPDTIAENEGDELDQYEELMVKSEIDQETNTQTFVELVQEVIDEEDASIESDSAIDPAGIENRSSNRKFLIKVDVHDEFVTDGEPLDEMTRLMREAHFAKEQQKKYKCDFCDKYFMFPSKVTRHINAVHKNGDNKPTKFIPKNHACIVCGKAFSSAFKVRRHMVVHDTELKTGYQKNWTRNYFECDSCNRKFHTITTFERHSLVCDLLQDSLITRPDKYEYYCVICAQIFLSPDDMMEHMRIHEVQEEYNCILCQESFTTLPDIIRHGKNHEENAVHRCIKCVKFFGTGDDIVTHLLRHQGYKPHQCLECDRRFFDKYKLKAHMLTHFPDYEKTYVCEFCNQSFAQQDYLVCHIRRRHSTEKPYHCTWCPKKFSFLHDLNLHMTNHTNTKPHVCKVCDASFTKSWSLKQHLRTHNYSTQSFACDLCDFTTESKSKLRSHITMHIMPGRKLQKVTSFQRPIIHICQDCGIEFKTLGMLRDHVATHLISRSPSPDPSDFFVEVRTSYN